MLPCQYTIVVDVHPVASSIMTAAPAPTINYKTYLSDHSTIRAVDQMTPAASDDIISLLIAAFTIINQNIVRETPKALETVCN